MSFLETWAENDLIFNNSFSGYTAFSTARQRTGDRGRYPGGVCTIVRNELVNYVQRVNCSLHDCVVLLFDGKLFSLGKDVLLINAYISPQYSTVYGYLPSRNGVELLENEILDLMTKLPDVHIIVAGDLNARTGVEPDFIFDDDTAFVCSDFVSYDKDDFYIPRVSKDQEMNKFGRDLLSLCCSFNLHFLNGRVGDDANQGDYTCIANAGN